MEGDLHYALVVPRQQLRDPGEAALQCVRGGIHKKPPVVRERADDLSRQPTAAELRQDLDRDNLLERLTCETAGGGDGERIPRLP